MLIAGACFIRATVAKVRIIVYSILSEKELILLKAELSLMCDQQGFIINPVDILAPME